MIENTKRVVTIGGGTGTYTVLSALKSHPLHLSAILSMADDGQSTGILRDQYGVLPAGDIRRGLTALAPESDLLRKLFIYRFEEGLLQGHNFGNLFLLALEKVTGDFSTALREAAQLLNIEGEIIPATLDNVRLYAELEDGTRLYGEHRIDVPREKTRARIKRVWLEPEARLNPSVARALRVADLVVIGPGDLYTSLIPNFLVKGAKEALQKSRAKVVYIGNCMTKFGETQGFTALDFFSAIEKWCGEGRINYALWNSKKPAERILTRYKKEQSEFVAPPKEKNHDQTQFLTADILDTGPLIRHSQEKLAKALLSLL